MECDWKNEISELSAHVDIPLPNMVEDSDVSQSEYEARVMPLDSEGKRGSDLEGDRLPEEEVKLAPVESHFNRRETWKMPKNLNKPLQRSQSLIQQELEIKSALARIDDAKQ